MSDKILSQEEIDALLQAVAKGSVDLEEEKKPVTEVKPYDLTSKSVILRDQFDALEEVYEKFAGLMRFSLSAFLQRSIELDYISTEMEKFGRFIGAFTNPTSFNIFSMEPLIGSSMMAIEAPLVFSLVDCMFGGEGKPGHQVREFTPIEQRMMGRLVLEFLKEFEKAWQAAFPVKIALKKTESRSEFVHLLAPNDLVVAIVFSLNGATFSGNIQFCIPYLMLEPIKDKLSSRYLREKFMEHSWGDQLRSLLLDTPVTLIAELGRAVHTVRDLLDLEENDVLKLSSGPQDYVSVHVEEVPKYFGMPGSYKGNRAVQIVKPLFQNGRSNKHVSNW